MTTIMPMGDSITKGVTPGGYRGDFYSDMASAGLNVQMVGDQNSNPGGSLPDDQTAHEGIDGITTAGMDDYVNATQLIANIGPDAVLLLIGTNDLGLGQVDPGGEVDRLSSLIDDIHGQSLGTTVFVANLLARADDGGGYIDQTNSLIPDMVGSKGGNTVFVNMHDALTTDNLADGLHPDAGGNTIMGGVWSGSVANWIWNQPQS